MPKRLISNDFRNGKRRQERVPRPPVRAIAVKAAELRAAARLNPLDFDDIHARYADLWAECRMVIWRAKHSKRALSTRDPLTGAEVDGFVPDDKTVLDGQHATGQDASMSLSCFNRFALVDFP